MEHSLFFKWPAKTSELLSKPIKMNRFIFIFSILAVLTSCSSVPTNFGAPPPNSKIGLYFLIDDHPKHEHVGTTIFQNNEAESASSTNFKDKFHNQITGLLKRNGHQTIKLAVPKNLMDNRFSLFSYFSGSIHFKDEVKILFDQAASKNDLDFIIIVHPMNGPAWPNSSAYIDGYGLYTHCRFGECAAEVLDHVSARIYDTKNKSSLAPMNFRYYQRYSMPEVDPSKGLESISSKEIDLAAAKALSKFMGQFSDMMQKSGFAP